MKDPFTKPPIAIPAAQSEEEKLSKFLGRDVSGAHILMVVRVDQPHVDDCTVGECAGCKAEVWISPSSKKLYDEGAVTLCHECLLEALLGWTSSKDK